MRAQRLFAGLVVIIVSSLVEGGFVQRSGHQLLRDGQPWYFLGADAYWLMDVAKVPAWRDTIDNFFSRCNDHGLTAVRMWGFNHNCPQSWGVYDETEMQGFDYIIASAGKHNIHLILALGNTWTAYRSPEDLMRIAGEDPSKTDLLGFYQSEPVKRLYKDHMSHMVNRINTFTGVAYKDDPTIMLWDVFNEPRCPGCTEAWQQAAQQSWLHEMSSILQGLAPNQLVAAGTEGYFMDDANVKWNPGAGSYCEGEDWVAISSIPTLDVSIAHIYARQLESVPPSWGTATWDDVMNWFQGYLQAHVAAASNLGKPLIVEEFNIQMSQYSEDQRSQIFQLVIDFLRSQKSSGGPMAGAMFWNGAIGSSISDDGYNIYLDVGAPSSSPAATLPSGPGLAPGGASAPAPTPAPQPAGRPAITPNTETLDGFRRRSQRDQCAQQRVSTWQPAWIQDRPVNVASYQSRTQGRSAEQILRDSVTQF